MIYSGSPDIEQVPAGAASYLIEGPIYAVKILFANYPQRNGSYAKIQFNGEGNWYPVTNLMQLSCEQQASGWRRIIFDTTGIAPGGYLVVAVSRNEAIRNLGASGPAINPVDATGNPIASLFDSKNQGLQAIVSSTQTPLPGYQVLATLPAIDAGKLIDSFTQGSPTAIPNTPTQWIQGTAGGSGPLAKNGAPGSGSIWVSSGAVATDLSPYRAVIGILNLASFTGGTAPTIQLSADCCDQLANGNPVVLANITAGAALAAAGAQAIVLGWDLSQQTVGNIVAEALRWPYLRFKVVITGAPTAVSATLNILGLT